MPILWLVTWLLRVKAIHIHFSPFELPRKLGKGSLLCIFGSFAINDINIDKVVQLLKYEEFDFRQYYTFKDEPEDRIEAFLKYVKEQKYIDTLFTMEKLSSSPRLVQRDMDESLDASLLNHLQETRPDWKRHPDLVSLFFKVKGPDEALNLSRQILRAGVTPKLLSTIIESFQHGHFGLAYNDDTVLFVKSEILLPSLKEHQLLYRFLILYLALNLMGQGYRPILISAFEMVVVVLKEYGFTTIEQVNSFRVVCLLCKLKGLVKSSLLWESLAEAIITIYNDGIIGGKILTGMTSVFIWTAIPHNINSQLAQKIIDKYLQGFPTGTRHPTFQRVPEMFLPPLARSLPSKRTAWLHLGPLNECNTIIYSGAPGGEIKTIQKFLLDRKADQRLPVELTLSKGSSFEPILGIPLLIEHVRVLLAKGTAHLKERDLLAIIISWPYLIALQIKVELWVMFPEGADSSSWVSFCNFWKTTDDVLQLLTDLSIPQFFTPRDIRLLLDLGYENTPLENQSTI